MTNVESITTVDPGRSTLEFWEAHEGMRVTVNDVRVVGPGQPEFGEIYVTTKPDELRTPRGGTYIRSYAETPTGRLLILPVNRQVPAANVGDVLSGATTGPGRLVHLRRLRRRGHHASALTSTTTFSRPRRPRRPPTSWPSRPTTSRTSTPRDAATSSLAWPRAS